MQVLNRRLFLKSTPVFFIISLMILFALPTHAQTAYDFSLSASGPHNGTPGNPLYILVTTTLLSGTPTYVYYSVTGLPAGITASFPDLIKTCCGDGKAYGPGSTALQLTITSTTTMGTYPVTIVATSGGVTKQIPYTFSVNAVPGPITPLPFTSLSPTPNLSQWETNMTSYGQTYCNYFQSNLTDFSQTYYDSERVFYQIGDYTKNSAWNSCAGYAETAYRDNYVLPNNGSIPGYWNFTTGLTMDVLRTSDQQSRTAVAALAQNAGYAGPNTQINATVSPLRSRETAYGLIGQMNAEKADGALRTDRINTLTNEALGHIDQWFVSKSYRMESNPEVPQAAGQYYIQPFMVGLTMDALIQYYQKTNDPRVPLAVKTALDWLWTYAWVPTDQAFWYQNWVSDPSQPFPAAAGAPDLNMLIAPAYAWYYRLSGDTAYITKGDQIFSGGVLKAWLGGSKQFNQNYRWSFDYINWRNGSTPTPPSSDTTAPSTPTNLTASSISSSHINLSWTASTDNVGVTGYRIYRSGVQIGTSATTVYSDTGLSPSTTYAYTAAAYDAAGNVSPQSSSASATTLAASDTTPPTVSLTAPASGATVSGIITVSASASDNIGVAGVQFKLDGANLGSEDTTTPYAISWDTTTASNTAHTLSATARDTAGNTGSASSVSVTVSNAVPPPPPAPKFVIGDRIKTIDVLRVRKTPCGQQVGKSQPAGTLGTITAGPSTACGYTWWQVNYDSGSDGWSAEDWLVKASAASAAVTTPVATTDTDRAQKITELQQQLQMLQTELAALVATANQ